MEEFKKGDFVKLRDGRLGVVAEICGNQVVVRLNNMAAYIAYTLLDKINGKFVPIDLSDAEVRRNLRGIWCQLKYEDGPEPLLIEVPCCGFRKWSLDGWRVTFEDGDYITQCHDAEELMNIATIDGIPVAAVEEIKEGEGV